jgi:2-methylaconitate isomerase
VAVAARIPGTIPHRFCRAESGPLTIGHPSGTTVVDAAVTPASDGSFDVQYGAVYRSARRLFEGNVLYRGHGVAPSVAAPPIAPS